IYPASESPACPLQHLGPDRPRCLRLGRRRQQRDQNAARRAETGRMGRRVTVSSRIRKNAGYRPATRVLANAATVLPRLSRQTSLPPLTHHSLGNSFLLVIAPISL